MRRNEYRPSAHGVHCRAPWSALCVWGGYGVRFFGGGGPPAGYLYVAPAPRRSFPQHPGTPLRAGSRPFCVTEEAWLGTGKATKPSAEVSVAVTLPSPLPSPQGCCSQELLRPPTRAPPSQEPFPGKRVQDKPVFHNCYVCLRHGHWGPLGRVG